MIVIPPSREMTRYNKGFTILELLMVLAVMGIALGLFVFNVEKAIDSVVKETVNDVLFKSVRQARLAAVTEKKPVYLSFDESIGAFQLTDHTGYAFAQYPIDERDFQQLETIRIWPILPMHMRASGRSYQEFEIAESSIARMQFEPTGISSFVAFELSYKTGISDSIWILVDPFSNGKLEGDLK